MLAFLLLDERWLLYFDPEDEEKMIDFSSNAHLRHLSRALFWIMDGTFKTAPKIVCQIYEIHGNVHGSWVPLVFALLEKKSKETYIALFEVPLIKAKSRPAGQLSANPQPTPGQLPANPRPTPGHRPRPGHRPTLGHRLKILEDAQVISRPLPGRREHFLPVANHALAG